MVTVAPFLSHTRMIIVRLVRLREETLAEFPTVMVAAWRCQISYISKVSGRRPAPMHVSVHCRSQVKLLSAPRIELRLQPCHGPRLKDALSVTNGSLRNGSFPVWRYSTGFEIVLVVFTFCVSEAGSHRSLERIRSFSRSSPHWLQGLQTSDHTLSSLNNSEFLIASTTASNWCVEDRGSI
jgi:hypothetical protein